jgi:hypothetical protein
MVSAMHEDDQGRNTPEFSGRDEVGRFTWNNPGKPKGARCKAILAAEAILNGEAESLTRKAVELALEGDSVALKICIERLVPARKDRPVSSAKRHDAAIPFRTFPGST